ncbi:TraB/GumN family protein [Paracrocinitomix mangrovi]|uniref:TraB/GumN family protein n=1 Tax=Paracrocinitomix mangrovi TaxID=2862509 RepID=UPI001C8D10ED|nr:TraB/GumN family protein [Paracrocinitomix mangrovi]UKN02448.1 TraB/GumN family protein [Paracrocinitomix mangrovi]
MLRFLVTTISILSIVNLSFAQKKYQGLLWEISGNGLSEPSYLYGTMHVSNKLAFNVSDSFYHCLSGVDAIALESSPETWMDEYREMGSFGGWGGFNYGSDFYKKAFSVEEPGNEFIYGLLENKNGLMNQILYRFHPGNEDYQENTYLDMFIFQAGAKTSRPIHSLETFDEVNELSVKSMTPDKEKKRDNSNNSYLENNGKRKYVLLEEAYRRGDLDQIDSLSKANNPTSVYHKYFIVERNKNMMNRLDSIMKTQSVFTGIGAAHLPGEEGAIELLRDKGYTVRPVSNKSTSKSHKMRKKMESLYRAVDFKKVVTTDGFIEVNVPGKLYEMPTYRRGRLEYLCPEPINGGYFSVIRLFTFGSIYNKEPEYYKETFDSLLYIATPGEIMKKDEINVNGHFGYNILTKTSKNAFVNYNVFFTPTEIIVFKGSGIGEYIEKSEPQSFFNNIKLAPLSSDWKTISPKFAGASWSMKGMVSGQDMIEEMDETSIDPLYQSYDAETKAYFQVMRYHYNDLDYIEEDSFDLYFLGKKYADQLGYEIYNSTYNHNGTYAYVTQQLKKDEDHPEMADQLRIKILTKAGAYYMMSTTAEDADANKFFDSFNFTAYDLNDEYEVWEDTNLFYSVNTIKKDDKPNMRNMGYGYFNYREDDEEDKSYLSDTKSKNHFYHKTNESVWVGYVKFHDYEGADSLEQFWDYRTERLTDENGFIVSRKKESNKDGDLVLDFMLSDTGSAKGILTKFRLHHGVLYTLQTLIDTIEGPSAYQQKFFDSFSPKDTLIGRDIFEDKAQVFIEHALGEDSLQKVNSMKSINKVDFQDKDVSGIIKIYNEFEFDEEEETDQKEDLIMALGNREVEEAYDFLYEVYDSNNFNSDLQMIVLKCFSYTETQHAYDAIQDLLIEKTPFTEKKSKLSFFNNLYDSLELATGYYPEMLDLVVYPEYKPYVVELLADGYKDKIFDYKHFAPRKNIIFRDAYIELKRTVANQEQGKKKGNYYNISQTAKYHTLFMDYYALMCGFKKNGVQETDKFFKDIYRIKNKKFLLEAEIIHHQLGLDVDTAKINEVANDLDYRVWAYNRLDDEEMLEFYTPTITQEDMAFALLYNKGYDEEEDTVVFVRKEYVDNGKDQGYVYFFKRKTEDTKNWMIDYVGLMPAEENEMDTHVDTKKGLSVKNDEEIELTIEKTLEIYEYEHRKRVVVTGYDWGSWGGLF